MAISLPVPPPEEQSVLREIINEETKTLGNAVDRSKQEISLIREYRTRLFSYIVTGQIDVREAAERLPSSADQKALDDGPLDLSTLDPEEEEALDDDPELLPVAADEE